MQHDIDTWRLGCVEPLVAEVSLWMTAGARGVTGTGSSSGLASPTHTPGPTSLNREIRHRTDTVGVFPDRNSPIRPVGAVPAEQHDELIEGHRYLGLDVRARSLTSSRAPTSRT
jgi:hypothetical protein